MKNIPNRFWLTSLVSFLAVVAVSCRSVTEVTGSWKNPAKNSYSYQHIVITALSSNVRAKSTVENDVAAQLDKHGVKTSKGTEIFPPKFTEEQPDKDEMLDAIQVSGADAILTITLVDKETESRFVPGALDYSPFPRYSYYGRFGGYYSYWQPRVYSQGYYADDKIYYLETNVYDADSEQLIWSAQSETYNPSSLESFSENFAKAIVKKLKQENVL